MSAEELGLNYPFHRHLLVLGLTEGRQAAPHSGSAAKKWNSLWTRVWSLCVLSLAYVFFLPVQAFSSGSLLYHNKQFGFDLSYPDTWESITPFRDAIFALGNGSATINIRVARFSGDPASFAKEIKTDKAIHQLRVSLRNRFPDAEVLGVDDVRIDNHPAFLMRMRYTTTDGGISIPTSGVIVFCIRKTWFYTINFESFQVNFPTNYEQFNSIIKSFKFRSR